MQYFEAYSSNTIARSGKVSSLPSGKPVPEMNLEEDIVISHWQELSFRGSHSKTVAPGGILCIRSRSNAF